MNCPGLISADPTHPFHPSCWFPMCGGWVDVEGCGGCAVRYPTWTRYDDDDKRGHSIPEEEDELTSCTTWNRPGLVSGGCCNKQNASGGISGLQWKKREGCGASDELSQFMLRFSWVCWNIRSGSGPMIIIIIQVIIAIMGTNPK